MNLYNTFFSLLFIIAIQNMYSQTPAVDHATPTIKTTFVTDRNGAVIYLDTIKHVTANNPCPYGSRLEVISVSNEWYCIKTNLEITLGNNIPAEYNQVYVQKSACGPYFDVHLNTEQLQSTIHPYFLGEDNDIKVRTDYETFFSLTLIDSATFHQQLKSAVTFIIYDTLSNKKQNGKTVLYCTQQLLRFVDDTTNVESQSIYTYIGQLPALDLYLVEGQFYEEMSYFFIDKQSGNTKATFSGMPYLSPDKKSIITLDSNPYEMLGELVLYQLNSDNTITHRASIYFDQWMPSPLGKIFWGADGNLYFNANTTATYWDETGNFPTRFDYIKLTPSPNN